jgi:hypothetical protein
MIVCEYKCLILNSNPYSEYAEQERKIPNQKILCELTRLALIHPFQFAGRRWKALVLQTFSFSTLWETSAKRINSTFQ